MTDRRNFLSAIRDDPCEDTLRLAFADWLEERGEADRALFVREQVAVECLPAGSKVRPARRAWELLFRNADRWIGDDLGHPGHGLSVAEATFRGGVLSALLLTEDVLWRRGERWLDHAPARAVKLRPGGNVWRLADNPALGRLASLDLSNCVIGDREAACLARSPHVAGINSLDLSRCPVGVAGLRDILSADSGFASLGVLELDASSIEPADLERAFCHRPELAIIRGGGRADDLKILRATAQVTSPVPTVVSGEIGRGARRTDRPR